jgi:hypothetical protein
MKISTIIIGVLMVWSTNSFAQNTSKVLLVKYSSYEKCKEVIIEGDSALEGKWSNLCDIPTILDDFSTFYHCSKVFYAEAKLTKTSEVKLIFWDYGYIKEVKQLPFTYGDITILHVVKDSILKIKFQDEIHLIHSYQQISDSFTHRKKGDNYIRHKRTFFTLENLGLLDWKYVYSNSEIPIEDSYSFITKQEEKELDCRLENGIEGFRSYFYNALPYTFPSGDTVIFWISLNAKGIIETLEYQYGPKEPYQSHIESLIRNAKWTRSKRKEYYMFHLSLILP